MKWTARLTEAEANVMKKFSCSEDWLDSFKHEWEVNLEVETAPRLSKDMLDSEDKMALETLEANAYVWPANSGEWTLDEYGLPIYLALLGRKSSCSIETI